MTPAPRCAHAALGTMLVVLLAATGVSAGDEAQDKPNPAPSASPSPAAPGTAEEGNPAAAVTGRLVDADGKPRAGVELETRFRRKGGSYWAEFSEEPVKTDREGRFHIEALIPGHEYQLRDEKASVQFGDGLRSAIDGVI